MTAIKKHDNDQTLLTSLLEVDIFKDLPAENLAALIPHLTVKKYPAETTILYRGDPGDSLFMIIEGTATVTRYNDEGIEYSLATLEKGQIFGEMALLTGAPRAANVKATTSIRLLELKQEEFFKLVAAVPAFSDRLIRLMVQRQASNDAKNRETRTFPKKENIATLFAEPPPEVGQLIGRTKQAEQINAAIQRLAKSSDHVLLYGERGTGKTLAAKLIHYHGESRHFPLYLLNCASPPPIQRESARKNTRTDNTLLQEISQTSALFGHDPDAGSFAQGLRRGYLELADGGTLILLHLDLLSLRVQKQVVKFLRTGHFIRLGGHQKMTSKTRVLATISEPVGDLLQKEKLDRELVALLGKETLTLRPLRERKKDIPLLADHFLQEYARKYTKEIRGFSNAAINMLVDHDWPLNADEMKQIVERAVILTPGQQVEENHIFLSVPQLTTRATFNILRFPQLRKLANQKSFPMGLQYLTAPFYLALILFTLFGTTHNNSANLLVWAFWWPFLIFSVLISGRSWCSYCPLPPLSDCADFWRKKYLRIPSVLMKNGRWLGIIGLALILLSEYATHMFVNPRATGVLLVVILAGTLLTNLLFGKRVWCKYVCPLGTMIVKTTPLSFFELSSNNNVCSSQCRTQDCIKNDTCPMGLHPATAAAGEDCIFCLNCVKVCQHQAVRINARLPWYGLINNDKRHFSVSFFAVLLVAMVLAVKIPGWLPDSITEAGSVSNFMVALLVLLVFLVIALLISGFPARSYWQQVLTVTGRAYLVLAFALFFNLYFHEFVHHGHNLLPWALDQVGLAGVIPGAWITPELGTLKLLIPLISFGGGAASLAMLAKLAAQHDLPVIPYRLHQGYLVIITVLSLFLF